eukprot:gene2135-8017_t
MASSPSKFARNSLFVDRINPFNTESTILRLPSFVFIFGPIICVLTTIFALLSLWHSAVWHPVVHLSIDQLHFNLTMAKIAAVLVMIQTWCIFATFSAPLIPLPPEESLFVGTQSIADLRLFDQQTLEKHATFCKHCNRYRPMSAHHCSFLAIFISLVVFYRIGHLSGVTGHYFPIVSYFNITPTSLIRKPSGLEVILLPWGIVMSTMMPFAMGSFLLIHLTLICWGKTTLQLIVGDRDRRSKALSDKRSIFGKQTPFQRFQLVFGTRLWQIGLPITTSKDLRMKLRHAVRPLQIKNRTENIV